MRGMATPLHTETNGAQGNSVLISLLYWFIGTLPKNMAVQLLNVLNISQTKKTDVYAELVKVLYLEFFTNDRKPNGFKGIMKGRRRFNITDIGFDVTHALNLLPFVEVTRHHMVRVSGYVTGRSKQTETETRREKNGAELQDGLRHFCAQCDKWLPFLGLNAEGVRMCCGSVAQLLTREVAVSDRYQSTIKIPWVIDGAFVDWRVELYTLGSDPVGRVSGIVNNALSWNHKDMMTSTPQRHSSHGIDKTNRDGLKRIKCLLCRIPILNDFGQLVPMWVNLPAIKGDIFHPVARVYHGLSTAELNRIKDYNILLTRHTQLMNTLNDLTKSLKVSKLIDPPVEVQNHLKRYPKAQHINLNSVARVEEKIRSRAIKTIN